jgi:hypothetical protein
MGNEDLKFPSPEVQASPVVHWFPSSLSGKEKRGRASACDERNKEQNLQPVVSSLSRFVQFSNAVDLPWCAIWQRSTRRAVCARAIYNQYNSQGKGG